MPWFPEYDQSFENVNACSSAVLWDYFTGTLTESIYQKICELDEATKNLMEFHFCKKYVDKNVVQKSEKIIAPFKDVSAKAVTNTHGPKSVHAPITVTVSSKNEICRTQSFSIMNHQEVQ